MAQVFVMSNWLSVKLKNTIVYDTFKNLHKNMLKHSKYKETLQ